MVTFFSGEISEQPSVNRWRHSEVMFAITSLATVDHCM